LSKDQVDELVKGIERFKNGSLMSILSMIFGIATGFLFSAALPMRVPIMSLYLNITGRPHFLNITANRIASIIERRLTGALPYIVSGGLILILAVMLAIISFILFFMATGNMKKHDERLGLGRTGLIIALISALILAGGASIALFSVRTAERGHLIFSVGMLAMAGALVFLSILLMSAGLILFSIMLIRLSEEKDVDEGFKLAGFMVAAGAVLSLIPLISPAGLVLYLVAFILIYTSSKSSLGKLKSAAASP